VVGGPWGICPLSKKKKEKRGKSKTTTLGKRFWRESCRNHRGVRKIKPGCEGRSFPYRFFLASTRDRVLPPPRKEIRRKGTAPTRRKALALKNTRCTSPIRAKEGDAIEYGRSTRGEWRLPIAPPKGVLLRGPRKAIGLDHAILKISTRCSHKVDGERGGVSKGRSLLLKSRGEDPGGGNRKEENDVTDEARFLTTRWGTSEGAGGKGCEVNMIYILRKNRKIGLVPT